MRGEHSKKTKKLIMSIIAIIMLCNFAMPSFSLAASTEEGGSALNPLASFLCFIPDAVTNLLQHMFISLKDIEQYDFSVSTAINDYKILYSPGMIFSGSIPAFDINFISPGEDKQSEGNTMNMYSFVFYNTYSDKYNEYGEAPVMNWTNKDGITYRITLRANARDAGQPDSMQTYTLVAYKEDEGEEYALNEFKYITDILEDNGGKTTQIVSYLMSSDSIQNEAVSIMWNELNIGTWEFCDDAGIYYQGKCSKDIKSTQINGKTYEVSRWADYDEKDSNYIMITSKYGNASEKTILKINDLESELMTVYRNENIRRYIQLDIEEILKTEYSINIPQEELDQTTEDFINQLRNAIETNYPDALGETETRTYNNSARILQPIVAGWYKALRRIALVGLLSVLLYVGIRMTMTSASAQDKAKYKKMFKDWLVALCLLFILHYIMNITITVVKQINSVIGKSVIGPEGEDVLLTNLRRRIFNGASWSTVLSEVVIYAVITVYSVIFTIQYIRRTIYLAFLTTIAPLITLTYPLDKIKDGKAQAFDMWIKDYVFFTLLQVVHLLLYYVFVQTSVELSEAGNWLYAIVAIGFLTTAEKLMKKMFGFEKSKSMGTLAAGATGALVINAFNKMSHNPPKNGKNKISESSVGGGSSKNVRTASTNPLVGLMTFTMQNGGNMPGTAGGNNTGGNATGTARANSINGLNTQLNQLLNNNVNANETQSQNTDRVGENNSQVITSRSTPIRAQDSGTEELQNGIAPNPGVRDIGEETQGTRDIPGANSSTRPQNQENDREQPIETQHSATSTRTENSTRTPIRIHDLAQINNNRRDSEIDTQNNRPKRNVLGGIRAVAGRYLRPTVGKTAGLLLSATGGIIGFSAGVAQGDIGKALSGVAGGTMAGYYGGQKITNATFNSVHTVTHLKEPFERVADTWREGALGKEEAGNIKFDREFRRSEGYRQLKRNNTNFSDDKIQKMLNAGITDPKKMDKILKKNAKHPRKFTIEKAIGYAELADKCPESILYNNKRFIRYFHDRDIKITPEEIESMRKNIIEFK